MYVTKQKQIGKPLICIFTLEFSSSRYCTRECPQSPHLTVRKKRECAQNALSLQNLTILQNTDTHTVPRTASWPCRCPGGKQPCAPPLGPRRLYVACQSVLAGWRYWSQCWRRDAGSQTLPGPWTSILSHQMWWNGGCRIPSLQVTCAETQSHIITMIKNQASFLEIARMCVCLCYSKPSLLIRITPHLDPVPPSWLGCTHHWLLSCNLGKGPVVSCWGKGGIEETQCNTTEMAGGPHLEREGWRNMHNCLKLDKVFRGLSRRDSTSLPRMPN